MNEFISGLSGGFIGAATGGLATAIATLVFEPVNRLENRRDQFVEKMAEEIHKIKSDGAAYWSGEYAANSQQIRSVEQEIKAGLHGLLQDGNELFEHDEKSWANWQGQVRGLRMIVTGGAFGDAQELQDADKVLEIKVKSDDLVRCLKRSRHKLKRRYWKS